MARPRLGAGESERFQMKITTEELAAIDEWRFANLVGSRSEAIRQLVQVGLGNAAPSPAIGAPRSLRDDIAIAALTGLLATAPAMKGDTAHEAIALACDRMADLLLAERAKVQP